MGLITKTDQAVQAVHSCNSWLFNKSEGLEAYSSFKIFSDVPQAVFQVWYV